MCESTAKKESDRMPGIFGNNTRFKYRGMVASGDYGFASRVEYNDPNNRSLRNFIVKKSFSAPYEEESLRKEREYLLKLRGCMHIVQILDIPRNPLDPAYGGEWIILEWLEYGTIFNFIAQARRRDVQRLPNRLLWRLFLCLVKAVMGMAWPKNGDGSVIESEELVEDIPESDMLHKDLHLGNILVGDPPKIQDPRREHEISPILKVIDFGLAGEWHYKEDAPSGVPTNLYDVGMTMIKLVTLNTRLVPELDEPKPYPWLDSTMRDLIAGCVELELLNRPSLRHLSETILNAVANKGPENYPGRPEEEDEMIATLWKEIVRSAGTKLEPEVVELSS